MNWPNWNGQTCAIIASGPTAKNAEINLLRDRVRVIAIKKSIELAPFADIVYGCDAPWWRSVQGLMKFKGLKFAYDRGVCGPEYGIQKVEIDNPGSNNLLFGEIGRVGAGGNSGFQAFNLAIQFGAKRIILVGFDMRGDSGPHWYGRNDWAMANNPTDNVYSRWVSAFNATAPALRDRGISVINVSPVSALECFPKMSLTAAIEKWGMQVAA